MKQLKFSIYKSESWFQAYEMWMMKEKVRVG